MTSSTFIFSALAAAMLAGCAATADDPNAPPAAPVERVYRTGSHIPVRDPVPTTPEEKQRQADAARDALQNAKP
jgi:hypothetical protein